jgi:hypothetical protein
MKAKTILWILLATALLVSGANAQFGSLIGTAKNAVSTKDKDKQTKKNEVAPETVQSFTGPKKRLAVMEMDVKVFSQSTMNPNMAGGYTQTNTVSIPMPSDFGTGLTEMLTTSLVNSNRFILLERKALQDIQSEVMLGSGGAVNSETAAKPGALLGAQALIRGALTEYSIENLPLEPEPYWAGLWTCNAVRQKPWLHWISEFTTPIQARSWIPCAPRAAPNRLRIQPMWKSKTARSALPLSTAHLLAPQAARQSIKR